MQLQGEQYMMLQMALRRVWIGIATMFVGSVIVFIMTSILPGDVAQFWCGLDACDVFAR